MLSMIRPCFLVIDREFPGSISTRKLVIETAKFNVLTAYSGQEALEVFTSFPAVSGVVLDGGLDDDLLRQVAAKSNCSAKCSHHRDHHPRLQWLSLADYQLESFDPAKLLEILRSLKPEASAAIEKRNEELSREKLSDPPNKKALPSAISRRRAMSACLFACFDVDRELNVIAQHGRHTSNRS